MVATTNPLILYDIDTLTDEAQIVESKKLNAVKSMKMTKDAFILSYETDEEAIFESMERMVEKMQKTLEYCAEVVEKRTGFHVTQKKVVLRNGPAGRG